jgi:TRAP-type C4-dicarboxylate transport system permease small subunit
MTTGHDANSTGHSGNTDSQANALPLARLVHWMSLTEQTLAALFLFVIVSTMGAQVFARYFFGSPFSWSEEVSRMALIWMSFMAAAFVMAEHRHITVDVLSHRLSIRGQLWLECLSHIIVAGTCLMLLIGGRHFVWYMGKVGTPSLEIPKSLWYGAVSVGMLLMSIHSVVNLLQVLAAGRPTARDGMDEEEGFHLELEQGE